MVAGNGREFLQIQKVWVQFNGQTILRNIDLTIPKGQTLALIGESGCGKTVMLKTLIRLIQPTRGAVIFDDQNLADLDEQQLTQQRKRYGFVFQNAALFDSMTIGQNVAFPLRQHLSIDESDLRDRVMSSIREVGLPESVVAKKPAQLSGGMRKRVGLARALILEPEVVLYDEPTTGLDPIVSDVINELIMQTRRSRTVTSIVVTHDMRTARKVADRVVMFYPITRLDDDHPQVIFDGPPSELERVEDRRVLQFVRGEAGDRLKELRQA